MELTIKEELRNARAKHYLFKSKMRAYVDGSREVDESVLADYNACALGKWINEVGKVKLVALNEVEQLDLTHQSIHATANDIIAEMKNGNSQEAEALLDKIEEIGGNIISLIDQIETKLEG